MAKSRHYWKKFWHFIWEDDSVWSWIANVALAFILIKFIVYPTLVLLQTTHPVVAVVSESMEHDASFDLWWINSNSWYVSNGISKDNFEGFKLKTDLIKEYIIILKGKNPANIKVGNVIVFWSTKKTR